MSTTDTAYTMIIRTTIPILIIMVIHITITTHIAAIFITTTMITRTDHIASIKTEIYTEDLIYGVTVIE